MSLTQRPRARLLAPDTPVGNSASYANIAPGSRTSAGRYTVLNPAPPAPLPDWITGLLQDKINPDPAERPAPSPQAPSPAYAQAALARASQLDPDPGFSAEERAAMKKRAAELRAEGKRGAKRAKGLQAVTVTATAPELSPGAPRRRRRSQNW